MPATTRRRPSAHTLPKGLSSSRSLHLNLILPQDTLYLCEPNTCQANTFLSPYPDEASKWFTVSSVHRFTVVCMSVSFLRLSMDSLVRISTSAMITWSDERSCCRIQVGVPGKAKHLQPMPEKETYKRRYSRRQNKKKLHKIPKLSSCSVQAVVVWEGNHCKHAYPCHT